MNLVGWDPLIGAFDLWMTFTEAAVDRSFDDVDDADDDVAPFFLATAVRLERVLIGRELFHGRRFFIVQHFILVVAVHSKQRNRAVMFRTIVTQYFNL